jgi:hypothetical protein
MQEDLQPYSNLTRGRAELELEVIALRHQLAVLRR